jgi:hypothetical protein
VSTNPVVNVKRILSIGPIIFYYHVNIEVYNFYRFAPECARSHRRVASLHDEFLGDATRFGKCGCRFAINLGRQITLNFR